jgi:hypothetical protein
VGNPRRQRFHGPHCQADGAFPTQLIRVKSRFVTTIDVMISRSFQEDLEFDSLETEE